MDAEAQRAMRQMEVEQMAESGSNGNSSKGRILVVDDDRLVLATVTHGLSQAGYEVIDADNGDDAILLARQHRPELALLDIRMEGKSGFDVAAYLREYLHTPFMFLSAFADEDTVQQVKALGAVAYLVKPLDIGQILPTVAAAFANLPHRRADFGASAAAAPIPVAAAAEAALVPDAGRPSAPLDPVPLAVGVLMHRYSLQRAQALQRLHRLAAEERRSLAEQAERLVDAVELLARGQD
jgi:response regulator NasT